jgi:hypothetical protein
LKYDYYDIQPSKNNFETPSNTFVSSFSYHLSRSSSDPTTIFSLIKRQLVIHNGAGSVENTSVEDAVGGNDVNVNGSKSTSTPTTAAAANRDASPADSSGSNGTAGSGLSTVDPYPKKLRDTVNGRLKSDAIICTAIFVLTTLLHWSGFFARLQPNLNYVLWIMTGILGFSQHYVLPQLRKQLPWLCFSHPILKSREYGQFEVGCFYD